MSRALRLLPLASVVLLAAACSSPPAAETPAAAPAETAPHAAAASSGPQRVFGKVPTLNGAPSIVVLEPTTERSLPTDATTPVMDQVQQTFLPDVIFVRTGQQAEFRNSDEVLHNINVRDDETKTQAFNVAIPTDAKYHYTFTKEGAYGVRCDIHPAMSALIVVSSSPYAMQTDAQGSYEFAAVEPGAYRLVAYAGARKMEKAVEVSSGSTEATIAPGN